MDRTVLILLLVISLGAVVFGGQPAVQQSTASQSVDVAEANRLNAMVVKLYGERRYDEALPVAKRALELFEKAFGKDDSTVVSAVLNLAEVQYARTKYYESKDLFERALESYERKFGPDDLRVAKVLARLALNNYSLRRPHETEKLYRQALAIKEKVLGPDHREVAQSIYELAEYYQFEGDYEKAEPLYQRLLEIRSESSADGAKLEGIFDRYACLLRKQNREAEADQMEARGSAGIQPDLNAQLISGGVVNGKAIKLVQPPYPEEARAERSSGKVKVRILINENGDVLRACAIEGPKPLRKASESAAARSKFSPTTLEGKPVRVQGFIIYNFIAQ